MVFSPHREMAARLVQYRTEGARFLGEMRQVPSLLIPVFSEHREAKQASSLAEQAQTFEERQRLPPVLRGRRKAGTAKQVRRFEPMQVRLPPAWAEQPAWAAQAFQA
ncbi:MAG: hypothetical protein ABW047_07080 [Nitrospiraceae bacterium]